MLGDLVRYQKEFQKNKAVTIKNLFSHDKAIQIRNDYLNHNEFKTSFYTGEANDDGTTPLLFADKGTTKYKELTETVNDLNAENRFTYRFSRTEWIHPSLYELWNSSIFSTMLSQITGHDNLTWVTTSTFTSKYESGDFLNIHTDENHGKIAFVYQLTENWKPGFGGLFMRIGDDDKVDKTVIPTFNELTLFDVSNNGVPHMVTQVIKNLPHTRIGYSGWLM